MSKKTVTDIRHVDDRRTNIPTIEDRATMTPEDRKAFRVAYERRDRDLDPQLVWRGKYPQDQQELEVAAPPLYIQEKVHPKAVIDDLHRETRERQEAECDRVPDLFSDFNGLPSGAERTDFYRHDLNWSNRMILGDSLHVMASLAEREGLRGKVQCIYIDPPYGIKFNSNFQWSVNDSRPSEGSAKHITREPEQVRAFRDTWKYGIHSYLTYLRDRLTVARDLLADSGSVFVQIGDENVHRVRAVMDEVFGVDNFVNQIAFVKSARDTGKYLNRTTDYVVWYGRNVSVLKYRQLLHTKRVGERGGTKYKPVRNIMQLRDGVFAPDRSARLADLTSQSGPGQSAPSRLHCGVEYRLAKGSWKTHAAGFRRLQKAERVAGSPKILNYVRFVDDYPVYEPTNVWTKIGGVQSRTDPKVYVVQTATEVVKRCVLMSTDPGDLVVDPTCGAGTTAHVAEHWGRRWITIDTSRVALALARARLMSALYPYYLLVDSEEGRAQIKTVTGHAESGAGLPGRSVRHGFVYRRKPHVTLRAIANNAEIDVVYDRLQPAVEEARERLNLSLRDHEERFWIGIGGRKGLAVDFTAPDDDVVELPSGEAAPANGFLEWEIPRTPGTPWSKEHRKLHKLALGRSGTRAGRRALASLNEKRKQSWTFDDLPPEPVTPWPQVAENALEAFWRAKLARQSAIDAVVAAAAEYAELYDKPYEHEQTVRVAGPFTVESATPHRMIAVGGEEAAVDRVAQARRKYATGHRGFVDVILENLQSAGVQQSEKAGRIEFEAVVPWAGGRLVCAQAYERHQEGSKAAGKRYAVFVGPEFGTVSRPDLVDAAREAAEMGAFGLIACAFNYDAPSSELGHVGRIPILKTRMNADLHMATDLKNSKNANLFVIFGEPDVELESAGSGDGEHFRVRVNGVDVYDPSTGEVRSGGRHSIACWFVDTNYDSESFRVRHAYFLGKRDPYAQLAKTLRSEIDKEAWSSLRRCVSRSFARPRTGRIAVKIINHLGDEVMKVIRV